MNSPWCRHWLTELTSTSWRWKAAGRLRCPCTSFQCLEKKKNLTKTEYHGEYYASDIWLEIMFICLVSRCTWPSLTELLIHSFSNIFALTISNYPPITITWWWSFSSSQLLSSPSPLLLSPLFSSPSPLFSSPSHDEAKRFPPTSGPIQGL